MINTSTEYKNEIKQNSRMFECKVTIGDRVFSNEDIVDIRINSNTQPNEGFSIGTVTSQQLELTLLNRAETIYSMNQIKVEIGLKIGNNIEYLLMGSYNIDDIEKTDYTIKFTAYDNMIKFETPYFSKLGDKATLQQIVNELATITGVKFTGSLPTYKLKKLEGFTCREVLGYVASLCAGNAVIKRDGSFTIVSPKEINYTIDAGNYIDYKREDVVYKIGKVSCQVGENIISKGALGTDSMELEFENPWIDDKNINDVYNKLKEFTYLGYTMKWQGDISLDIGDIATLIDKNNIERKIPIFSQSFTYTGGLTSELAAKGETKNKNSFSSNGNTNNKINRVVTELLIVNEALINKANIQDLQAINAEIYNLKVSNAEIENAIIKFATIERVEANYAELKKLIAGSATITDLNAAVGKIDVLITKTADIEHLLAGNITADNIQAGTITAGSGIIANGAIGDAQISYLSANKINTGSLDTSLVTIASADGIIQITGNQILVNKNNSNRVILGEYIKTDGTTDYGLLVRGKDNQTVMIDGNGVHNAGLTSDAIKDNVVANDANIMGYKLNINSVIREVNENGTESIQGTKVQVGDRTLDVELSTQKNTITEHGKELSSQKATIQAMDKAIKLKVDEQTFKQNINGLNTELSKTTSELGVLKGQIATKVSNTELKQEVLVINESIKGIRSDLNTTKSEFKQKTDSITANIDDLSSKTTTLEVDVNNKLKVVNTNVSNNTSQLNLLKNEINTKVSQSEIDKKVIEINNQIKLSNEKITTVESNFIQKTNSITQKVTEVQTQTTKLDEKVTSNTSRIGTAEQKLLPGTIISTVSEALSDGGVIKGVSTSITSEYFRVRNINNKARLDIWDGNISTYSTDGRDCIDIIEQNIYFYDWLNGNKKVGGIASARSNQDSLWGIDVYSELSSDTVRLGLRDSNGIIQTKIETSRKKGFMIYDNVDAVGRNFKVTKINQDNKGRILDFCNLQAQHNNLNGPYQSWLRFNVWNSDKVVINAGTGNAGNYGTCRARSWETINKSIQRANTKNIASYYTSSTEDTISDIGHGIIGESGETIIMFEDDFLAFADTKTAYFITYEVIGKDRKSVYTKEHNVNYFIVGGEVGQEFSFRMECKKQGDNCTRYYREFESDIEVVNRGLDNIEGIHSERKEVEERAGLINYIRDVKGEKDLELIKDIKELKEENKSMQILNLMNEIRNERGV
ncbi:hypothetical protein K5V21_03565 [Clostridium sardiniense]|uniref:Uncharacterized protein n=1 Tax=Clostridium sardiniense TaxID=29369 RepID=A0ABS7KUN7_CLOSR|nr:hypothetical protein [Clostridium sardiniense]MBY0754529.1 hypothetical protein [Clostridium sardiniense]MDQ0460875.1 hypothetical protein [Clostridium sardiniense]